MTMSESDFDSAPHWRASGPGTRSLRRVGLWLAAVAAGAGYLIIFPSAQVAAQTATPAAASTEAAPELQEVVVTGSRIPVPANISATSPRSEEHTSELQSQF